MPSNSSSHLPIISKGKPTRLCKQPVPSQEQLVPCCEQPIPCPEQPIHPQDQPNTKSTMHEYMHSALHIVLYELYCFF